MYVPDDEYAGLASLLNPTVLAAVPDRRLDEGRLRTVPIVS